MGGHKGGFLREEGERERDLFLCHAMTQLEGAICNPGRVLIGT